MWRLEQIDRHIEALDAEITNLIAADAALARRQQILTSIAGVGTLTANQLEPRKNRERSWRAVVDPTSVSPHRYYPPSGSQTLKDTVFAGLQLIATMPELGTLENKQAASLASLAPVARQSGQWKGKSFI